MLSTRLFNFFQTSLIKPRICTPIIFKNDYSAEKKKKPGFKISRDEVDIIRNPTMDYWESFMTELGLLKTNFKLSDHYIWRETFKKDYEMVFICLKGTKKVIACFKGIIQRPLPTHNNVDSIFLGFMHTLEEYRGTDLLKIVDEETWKLKKDIKNVLASCTDASYALWMRIFPTSEISYDLNWTYYKGENVKVPTPPLVFDDIILKSAHDAPDDDITKYDQAIYPFERREYMLRNLRDPEGYGKVAYNSDGKVIGFGTLAVYPSGDGLVFPLYADNDRVAQAIFQESLKDVEKAGKKIKNLEARFPVLEGFDNVSWMKPFLTHEPYAMYDCHHLHTYSAPVGIDMSKVYSVVFPSICSI